MREWILHNCLIGLRSYRGVVRSSSSASCDSGTRAGLSFLSLRAWTSRRSRATLQSHKENNNYLPADFVARVWLESAAVANVIDFEPNYVLWMHYRCKWALVGCLLTFSVVFVRSVKEKLKLDAKISYVCIYVVDR